MPHSIQAKILRLLQERSIERLGGRETIKVDVRIIAATNRDLEAALAEGRFREDLYYRLKVVTIELPPLRARKGDAQHLCDYFLARFAKEMGIDNPGLTEEALAVVDSHPWPGNVRELANALQKALIFSRGYPIRPEDIAQAVRGNGAGRPGESDSTERVIRQWIRERLASADRSDLFSHITDHFTALLISEALTLSRGNRTRAAKILGISRPTLHSKMDKYGLTGQASEDDE